MSGLLNEKAQVWEQQETGEFLSKLELSFVFHNSVSDHTSDPSTTYVSLYALFMFFFSL